MSERTNIEHNHNQCGHIMVYLWFIILITRLSPGDRSCSPGSGPGWTLLRPEIMRTEFITIDIDTVMNTYQLEKVPTESTHFQNLQRKYACLVCGRLIKLPPPKMGILVHKTFTNGKQRCLKQPVAMFQADTSYLDPKDHCMKYSLGQN